MQNASLRPLREPCSRQKHVSRWFAAEPCIRARAATFAIGSLKGEASRSSSPERGAWQPLWVVSEAWTWGYLARSRSSPAQAGGLGGR